MVILCVISDPKHTCAGVPQASILGTLLSLVYINDIVEEIESNINLFADDTCLSMVVGSPNAAGTILQNDIDKQLFGLINGWLDLTNQSQNLLQFAENVINLLIQFY